MSDTKNMELKKKKTNSLKLEDTSVEPVEQVLFKDRRKLIVSTTSR